MIPVLDLKAQYQSIESEIDLAMKKVLQDTDFILGAEVQEFEERLAAICNCRYGIGLASGTDAIRLALLAAGIGPGDEVITTPFTFIATANTISHSGAKPVFVDIDARTFNLNPDFIESAITNRTKAILPVHLYGQPADMDPIQKLADKHGLLIVEDCAQAIASCYKNRVVGSFGIAGCLSFYPSKNLGAYGDAGMLVTNSAEIAEKVDMLRRHGGKKKYHAETLGFNSRLDTLQAAILGVKLNHLDEWTQKRRSIAGIYNRLLQDIPVITPFVASDCLHVYHQYTIRTKLRDQLGKYLKDKGIGTMVYYPVPLHQQSLYARDGIWRTGDFPISEQISQEVLSLPIYPELTLEQQEEVVSRIREFLVGTS